MRSNSAKSGEPGELVLLERIRAQANRSAKGELRLGIGDDCAILRPRAGEELAVTTDLSISGRHFRLDWHPPAAVGHRTLARGLSDLASMGARPVAAFLSLGLPKNLIVARRRQPAWVDRFFEGFLALADTHRTPLAGGDLAESPITVADIILVGAVPLGRAFLRSSARPGDLLYVTGDLGGAAAALTRLKELMAGKNVPVRQFPRSLQTVLAPHLFPQPRIAQGLHLQRMRLATAAIDLSDGLSTDLAHLCAESGLAAEVEAAALPIHHGATFDQAINGGEDYELLFTAQPSTKMPRSIGGVPVTCIGRMIRTRRGRPDVTLLTTESQRPLEPGGWQHFS